MYANWAVLDIKKSPFQSENAARKRQPRSPESPRPQTRRAAAGPLSLQPADIALMGFCLAKLAVHSLATQHRDRQTLICHVVTHLRSANNIQERDGRQGGGMEGRSRLESPREEKIPNIIKMVINLSQRPPTPPPPCSTGRITRGRAIHNGYRPTPARARRHGMAAGHLGGVYYVRQRAIHRVLESLRIN